jgi:hypothetical protein
VDGWHKRIDDLRIDLPLVWRAVAAALAAGVLEFDGNLVVETSDQS